MPKSTKNLRRAVLAPAFIAAMGFSSVSAMAANNCQVKVGFVGPLSGAASAWGLAYQSGTDFIAALTNQNGGLQVGDKKCDVKVFPYDSHMTAAGGAAASNYFASESIHAVMGPIGSPVTQGFRPVASRNDQVDFATSYLSDVIGPKWPLVFHSLQGPLVVGPVLVKAAERQFKFKTVVLVGPNDETGKTIGDQDAKLYKSVGVKPTEEFYQRGTTNFAPLAQRIMNENPDAVEIGSLGTGDVRALVKALTDAGYSGIYGGIGGIGLGPVKDGAGGIQNIKGYFWLELVASDSPGAVKLRDDYKKVMKADPPANALLYSGAIAMEQMLQGISNAGTDADGKKIADALRAMTPKSQYFGALGWRGKEQYGVNQELAFPIGMGVISDGKLLGIQSVSIPSEK